MVSISTCFCFSPSIAVILKQPRLSWGACLLFIVAGVVIHDRSKPDEAAGNRADIKRRSSGVENPRNGPIIDSSGTAAVISPNSIDSPVRITASRITSAEPGDPANPTALGSRPFVSASANPQPRNREPRKSSFRDQSPVAETTVVEGSGTSNNLSVPDQSGAEGPATPENQSLSALKRPVSLPVAMIDMDDPQVSDAAAIARIDAIAREFANSLNASGLDPSDPAYRELWNEQSIKADTLFRSMYGGHAWLRHHVQLHRTLATTPSPEGGN